MSDNLRGQLLVIDDEEEVVNALRRQFRRKYDVYTAVNGAAGLEVMFQRPIHVIISDQRMPGMTGAEFYHRVRNEYPDAIRLLLTGYADIEAVIEAINAGSVYRYITKPWDPVELEATVDQAFETYGLIVQNRVLMVDLWEANERLEERVTQRTAELQQANERLQVLNEQKDRFLGMAAHDLRNPLGSVSAYARLLQQPELLDAAASRTAVLAIDAAAQRMLRLVDELLDIAQIETGTVELALEEVALADYLESMLTLNRPIGSIKGIALSAKLEAGLATWRFDPSRTAQVLDNLVSNAFKFSFPGTEVRLSARVVDDALEFSVADQGQGIPEAELGQVFGEFCQTSTRSTAGERGAGLGLAICRRIVELHGGDLSVTSEVGTGSCFSFRLPRRGEE